MMRLHYFIGLQITSTKQKTQTSYTKKRFNEQFASKSEFNHCLAAGGAVAQSIERATPGEEVPVSIPAVAARSLLVGSVSV